ncbi:ubiquitin-like protein Pup [Aeromicrobium sp. Sec7.5]|uniref:ubiquitin-like protein Pup n=1 Tax=Aeromicrobium sp. Sec7.5 TaxID=3121276 RepID=UPI002FE44DFA
MSEQQHRSNRPAKDDEQQVDAAPVDSEAKAKLDDDVDSILDEIDDVLEDNAEEFVRSFVQKGGQ